MEKQHMTRAVQGADINVDGVLFGGALLSWMDELAGIAGRRFAKGTVVTVAVEGVSFLKPVSLGAFVDLEAQVASVGTTSMKIALEAWAEDPAGRRELAAKGTFVFVCVDAEGKPRKIGGTEGSGFQAELPVVQS